MLSKFTKKSTIKYNIKKEDDKYMFVTNEGQYLIPVIELFQCEVKKIVNREKITLKLLGSDFFSTINNLIDGLNEDNEYKIEHLNNRTKIIDCIYPHEQIYDTGSWISCRIEITSISDESIEFTMTNIRDFKSETDNDEPYSKYSYITQEIVKKITSENKKQISPQVIEI
jgi:hypothetical protein